MFRRLFTALSAVLPMLTFAQTSISGIVNNYYKVVGINTTQSYVQLNNTSGLVPNDKVMIIQMKGAGINTNSSFGTIKNINGAGDYELNTVCSINGTTVYLVNTLLHTYSVADKVQLVKIPTYGSAIVVDSLKAAPWDSTAGTGGVVAINVTNTLTLQAPVSATGKGFQGGKFIMGGGNCIDNIATGDYYNPTSSPQMGAYKGEGVADVPLSERGGRAAIANGGGGGNNHNTGGGGGAHIGAGGMGGNNTTTNGCSSSYEGFGGNALTVNNAKLFFGGGGGAGHGNNTVQSGGGAGGGIVFIQAGTLVSNGFTISANGNNGSNTIGDGASGGGAGGSVIMNIATYSGAASVTATGGNGGVVDNEGYKDRCFGDGGGGGGGVIYLKGGVPSTTAVTGGAKGGKINSPGCNGAGTSTNGGNGTVITNASISQSSTASNYCVQQAILPVHLVFFKAILNNRTVYLEWKITGSEDADHFIIQRRTNGDWTDVKNIAAARTITSYQTADANLVVGNYQYRIKIVENTGAVLYSEIRLASIKEGGETGLIIYPNPVAKEINILGVQSGLLRIYDAAGRLVVEKFISANGGVKQDVSFLQEGIYLVKLNNATTRFVVKKD